MLFGREAIQPARWSCQVLTKGAAAFGREPREGVPSRRRYMLATCPYLSPLCHQSRNRKIIIYRLSMLHFRFSVQGNIQRIGILHLSTIHAWQSQKGATQDALGIGKIAGLRLCSRLRGLGGSGRLPRTATILMERSLLLIGEPEPLPEARSGFNGRFHQASRRPLVPSGCGFP